MPDAATLAVFVAACVALAASPGPDMLLIATRSAAQGRTAGFVTLAGIQLGTYCHALAAALGLAQLFTAVPLAYDAVRYCGAAYLMLLAYQAFRSSNAATSPVENDGNHTSWSIFRQGLITNLLNPKMAVFVLAFFPQFVIPDQGTVVLQIMVLATVLNIVGFVVNGTVIVASRSLGAALSRNNRYRRVPNLIMGSVFAGLALRLALDNRR